MRRADPCEGVADHERAEAAMTRGVMAKRRDRMGQRWIALAATVAGVVLGCGPSAPTPHYAEAERGGDRDGDGAADIDDACPDNPEDGLLPKANDGCPATDPDHDGVLLADDRCPNAKEDGLPPEPADGCPVDDRDGDGVADALDRCPDKLEDNQAPDPNDGCPSPDRDGDGIADVRDACPTQPETVNGYRDDDGCPDEPPGEIAFDTQASEVYVPETRKIEFDLDSADLTTETQLVVALVARVLTAHPEIGRVEIEGHASSKGDAAYNLSLTERRAQSVARALAKEGVAASRLVPIGYGEMCPAIDRGEGVDEPKNRRVLLKAVQVNL